MIKIEISADTRKFDDGIKGIESSLLRLRKTLTNISSTIEDAFDDDALEDFEDAIEDIGESVEDFGKTIKSAEKVISSAFSDISDASSKSEKKVSKSVDSMDKNISRLSKSTRSEMDDAGNSFLELSKKVESSTKNSVDNLSNLSTVAKNTSDSINQMPNSGGDPSNSSSIGGDDAQVKKSSSMMGKVKSGFSKMGGIISSAVNVDSIVQFGSESINLASNLQQVQKTVDRTFGDMSGVVDEFAKTSVTSFGLSESTSKETASTFMKMAKGLGITGKSATDMSLNLTGLSGDMASYYGVSQDIAKNALESVWSGDTESLKQFGITMSDANLQQFAYAKGETKKLSAMSESEKAMLRYKYVTEKFSSVQGDFSENSGDWANQTKILGEQWDSLKGTLGQGLITVLTPALQFLNGFIGKVAELGPKFAELLGKLVTDAKPFLDNLKSDFDLFSSNMKIAFSPSFDAWFNAFQGLDKPASEAFNKVSRSSSNLIENGLKPLFNYTVNEFAPKFANSFSEAFAPIIGDVLKVGISEFGKDWEFACNNLTKIIDDIVLPSMNNFQTVATDVFSGIKTAWDEFGGSILSKFEGFKESIRGIWDNLYNSIIKPIYDIVSEIIMNLWTNHLKPLWDNICGFVGSLIEMILTLWNNVLAPVVNWIIEKVGPPIQAVVKVIGDVVSTVIGTISDIIGGIIKACKGVMEFITGVFSGNWEKAWEGLKDFVGGIWDAIWGAIKGVINLIVDGINGLWSGIYHAIKLLVDGIGGIVKGIGQLLGQDNWGWQMPTQPPLIPKLAKGAVIPPNNEFLAVLGDQRNGVNIETPLSTMVDAFKIAIGEMGTSNNSNITLNVKSGDSFVRNLKFELEKESERVGMRAMMI